MVLCFIGLIVFSILGIFSAKYRKLAKEAFRCVFLKVTLRPCEGSLDTALKAETIKAFMFFPPLAAGILRHFEFFSSALTVIMLISLFYTAAGIYNFVMFGNCNGQDSQGFCLYGAITDLLPPSQGNLTNLGNALGSQTAKVRVIEFGCFSCQYTKSNEPAVKQLLENYGSSIYFVFKTFPIPTHNYSYQMALAAECAAEQGQFWQYKDALFANQARIRDAPTLQAAESVFNSIAADLDISNEQFRACYSTQKYTWKVDLMTNEGKTLRLYATPTFIINNRTLVGVQSYDQLKSAVDAELAK